MKTVVATGGDLALRWLPRSSAGRRAAACCCDEESCCELPPLGGPAAGCCSCDSSPPAPPGVAPPAAAAASLLPRALFAKPRSGDGAAAAGERACLEPVRTFPCVAAAAGWFSMAWSAGVTKSCDLCSCLLS
jgi:hypothetical protein